MVLALILGGCASAAEPTIAVAPAEGPFAPVSIRVEGLAPGAQVTLRAETDAGGGSYASAAEFTADGTGVIDLSETAPDGGGWSTADAMGPLWSLVPTRGVTAWSDFDDPHDVDLIVEDASGEAIATTTIERPGFASGVSTRDIDDGGIVASYSLPADLDDPMPGVLVLSGSEGGLEFAEQTARWIADLGYPAVAVSYFGEPGQPESLQNVPVEPVLHALDWLRAQPEVDPDAVFTFGISRGGELALWLAAEHPSLVAGAIAPVGAGYAVCGFPDFSEPAWTFEGEPLTPTCLSDTSSTQEGSQVDVAWIDGPVVLACGTEDTLWPSCTFLDDIVERRGSADTAAIHGEGASHYVASAPGIPSLDTTSTVEIRSATSATQARFWDAVAAVLAEAAR